MTLTDLINQATSLAQAVTPVLVALALLFFFWGVAQWILNMADSDKHKEGKQQMIWGLVALFFIVSIAGLLTILQATFFGSGNLHSTDFGDPSRFALPAENTFDAQLPGDPSLNELPGGHTAPDGGSNSAFGQDGKINNSFRFVNPGTTEDQPSQQGFEPFRVETWGCVFKLGGCGPRELR